MDGSVNTSDKYTKDLWSKMILAEVAQPSKVELLFGMGFLRKLTWSQALWLRITRQVGTRLRLIGIALGRIDRAESHLYPEEL